MAGMRPDLYQQMLREVSEQCRLADDAGLRLGRLHRAPLPHRGLRGLQQPRPARPLHRHADEAHPGRPARHRAAGVQPDPRRRGHRHARPHDGRAGLRRLRARLSAPLGRHHGAAAHGIHGALPHQHDEIDAANRAAFEECFQIIKKCWTEEMLSFQGKFWKIPPGETPWPLETTAKWGKGVENGILKSVGVVPKPLQKPHPPIFQPFASSENSIRWCAKNGVTAILPPMHETHRAQPVRGLRLRIGPQARRRHGHAARHHHRRHRRGGAAAVGQLGDVRRQRLVRAVRLPPRHARPQDGRGAHAPRRPSPRATRWSARSTP